jgi:hypothetical protein
MNMLTMYISLGRHKETETRTLGGHFQVRETFQL